MGQTVLGCCFDKHKDDDKQATDMIQKYNHLASVDGDIYENQKVGQTSNPQDQYSGDIEEQVSTPQASVKKQVNPQEELNAQIQGCLDVIVSKSDNDACIAGFDILHKLMQNILKDPTNQKFRTINRSNKAIASKLMRLKPEEKVEELLELLGYAKIDDDTSEMSGNKLGRLVQGARLVDNQSMRCKMVNMTPEERKKQELIMKEREDFQAAQKIKQAEKDRIQQLSQQNRKVKQAEQSKTAQANKLNFGGTIMKFQGPPTNMPPCMAKPSFKPGGE